MPPEKAEEEGEVRESDLSRNLCDGGVACGEQFLRTVDAVAVEPVERGEARVFAEEGEEA